MRVSICCATRSLLEAARTDCELAIRAGCVVVLALGVYALEALELKVLVAPERSEFVGRVNSA